MIKMENGIYAKFNTTQGAILVKLTHDLTPGTVGNFVALAEGNLENKVKPQGTKFYDGLKFHRVIPDFMIQGGCPQGTGVGGPRYKIKCELDGDNQFHDKGVLSMAHAGRDTGGSQFFIVMSRAQTAHLDRKHTCFGKVVEGLSIIDEIRQGDVIQKITISDDGK